MQFSPVLGFIFGGLEGIPLLFGAFLAVLATIRVCKRIKRFGPLMVWLLVVWLVPILGAILALLVIKRPPPIAQVREHSRSDSKALDSQVYSTSIT